MQRAAQVVIQAAKLSDTHLICMPAKRGHQAIDVRIQLSREASVHKGTQKG